MQPGVILWDIMDTLVRDPFFTHMPGFFGHSFEALVQRLQPGAWVEFELGKLNELEFYARFFRDGSAIDELEFYARFFRDGSAIDGPGLKACMAQAYSWIDGMPELLGELRKNKVRMCALSNYPEWYRLVEERLALSEYLELSFISCRTGFRKPAPEAFLHASKELGAVPEQCLLVDDRKQNCEAARQVGMHCLHFDGSIPRLREGLSAHGLL